jgi:regulation of enolase protein 1 (concanavalin A-like superfamily)
MDRDPVQIDGLPAPLAWGGAAESAADVTPDGLEMAVSATTDLFCDPQGAAPVLSAPRLLFPPAPRFTLSAHVAAELASTFDAGVLVLYRDDAVWAKLCLELSPQQRPMIVSVVTSGRSDDANAVTLDAPRAFLRVTGLGAAFAFHFSIDGAMWHLVRHFTLPEPGQTLAGFSVQSPTGTFCRATFTDIRYRPEAVADLRSGA